MRRPLILVLVVATAAVAGVAVNRLQQHAPSTLFETQSDFGALRVEERADGVRLLRSGDGRAVQTAMDPLRPLELQGPYTRVAMAGLAFAPPDGAMLFVGLGGGAMPTYVRNVQPDALLDAVEIDPAVIDIAIRYFGLRPDPQLRVHAADGRAFIEAAPTGSWHVIFLDAYADDYVPYSLATRQFLEAVARALTQQGVVVGNLWTGNPLYDAMVATYAAVFEHVAVIRVPDRAQNIIFASNGVPLDRQNVESAVRALTARTRLGIDLDALVRDGFTGVSVPSGPVLEDSLRVPATTP
jgi:spermidine synthase